MYAHTRAHTHVHICSQSHTHPHAPPHSPAGCPASPVPGGAGDAGETGEDSACRRRVQGGHVAGPGSEEEPGLPQAEEDPSSTGHCSHGGPGS